MVNQEKSQEAKLDEGKAISSDEALATVSAFTSANTIPAAQVKARADILKLSTSSRNLYLVHFLSL